MRVDGFLQPAVLGTTISAEYLDLDY